MKYDSHIPVPRPTGHLGQVEIIKNMPVGKSYLFKNARSESIRNSIQYVRRGSDKEFVSRSVNGGIRVWRTK